MKKIFLALILLTVLFSVFSASVSAIDTPWIPVNPDSRETESSTPSQEENKTDSEENIGDSATADTSKNSQSESVTATSTNAVADENSNTDASSKHSGCESVVNGYVVVLACCSAISICIIKSRKGNE